jgi:3-deoxy-D-manno-octulosonic-acid transferase
MTRIAHALYTVGLAVLVVAYWPVALWRSLARGVGLAARERLGFYRDGRGGGGAWVHAVSVGETLTAVPVIEGLHRLHPDMPIVLTTVTPTGARVAIDRLGRIVTHRYAPVDLPGPVRRAIAAFSPRLFVSIETELWPNLLRALAGRNVPVMVANGRISDRSYRRYRLVRWFMRRVLAAVTVFAMRDDEDARRIIALGADPERVFVTGNIKHDTPGEGADLSAMWRRLFGLGPRTPVWIAGSTHRGEEELVVEAHSKARACHPDLTLILAPRHPERVAEVERVIAARGLTAVRRSALPTARGDGAIIVIDTVGELAQIYPLADVVFVGGSLVPAGGHNMIEPALRRKPVLFGPHTSNFRESAELLAATGGGVVVADASGLARELLRLLEDPGLRAKTGEAAFEAVAARQGAVRETLDLIERFLIS